MTWRHILLLPTLLSAACTTSYIMEPAMGGAVGRASTDGLILSAEPNAWGGEPSNLPEYLTPVWVGITNGRGQDLRIAYADFALTDESGFRYAAISPYTGRAAPPPSPAPAAPPSPAPPPAAAPPSGSPPPSTNAPEQPEPKSMLYEGQLVPRSGSLVAAQVVLARYGGARGGGHVGGHFGGHVGGHFGGHVGGHFGGHPGPHHFGGPGYVRPHVGRGFYVHPYYRPYFHYYSPWPYFYYGAPYYGPYVYYWDYRYYPAAPSYDVMRLGLPEGVVKPGGSVSGFLYFQNAATRPGRLNLTWNAYTVDGQRVASVNVPFVVVED